MILTFDISNDINSKTNKKNLIPIFNIMQITDLIFYISVLFSFYVHYFFVLLTSPDDYLTLYQNYSNMSVQVNIQLVSELVRGWGYKWLHH